jgi:hypothetical protein
MDAMQRAGQLAPGGDSRREPTPDEIYQLTYDVDAAGRNLSPQARAALIREVRWPLGPQAGGRAPVADSRREPTADEIYRLTFDVGADGRNMSPEERAALIREVRWPIGQPAVSAMPPSPAGPPGPGSAAPPVPAGILAGGAHSGRAQPAGAAGSGRGRAEQIVRELFPVLAPIPFKVLVGGAAAIAGLVAVLFFTGVFSGSSIQAGDCVTTWTNPLDNNSHISTTSCSTPNAEKVLQVQDTPNGYCSPFSGADTTFQDQVTNQTYCLGPVYAPGSQP